VSVVLHAVLAGFMVGIRVITLTERGNVAEAADEVLPARLPHCPSAGWLGRAGGDRPSSHWWGLFVAPRQVAAGRATALTAPAATADLRRGAGPAGDQRRPAPARDLGGDPMDPNDEIIRDEDEENEEWPHQ